MLLALGCSGKAEEAPSTCDPARALAPGEARVALHWGDPTASIGIESVAEGAACDLFIAGTLEGGAAPWGEPVQNVSFLAHLDEASSVSWVETWPSSALQVGELAAAPEGGVWLSAQGTAPVDLGDGEAHAVGSGGRVLARYAASGRLEAAVVVPEESGTGLSSNVDAHRASLLVSGSELEFQIVDDSASALVRLPSPPSGGAAPFYALDADGGVRVASWQYPYMVVERYDAGGASVWKEQQLGTSPDALQVLPTGETIVLESHRGVEDPPPPTGVRQLGHFLELRAANGELSWEVEHDLLNATLLTNRAGKMVLVGYDDVTSHRNVSQVIDPSGTLGAKTLLDSDAFVPRSTVLGQRSFWIAGSFTVPAELAGEPLERLGVQDAVVLELGD